MLSVCFLLLVLGWYGLADAARTVNSEDVIAIKLELGEPTAVIFPEEISTVTTAMPAARLEISTYNVYAGFVAKDPALLPNRNIVVGISGRVYLVRVELVQPGKRGDDKVYVTHKAPAQAEILTPVSVLRALRSAKGPGPSQPLTLPLPTLSDPRVLLSQPRQYQMGPYQALVLTVENTQDVLLQIDERVGQSSPETPLTVQLHGWVWAPGRRLSAIAVEQTMLLPYGSTTLYAIFEDK